MARSSSWRLALLSCIWGTSFLLIKIGLEGLTPTQIVAGRLVAGAAVLQVGALAARQPRPDRRLWGHLLVMAAVANVLPFLLITWGEQRIPSGLAGVLNATTPLLTVVAALVIIPNEGATRTRVAGLVVGFAGTVVLLRPWAGGSARSSITGELACVLAAGFYGIGFAYARRYVTVTGTSPVTLAAGQLAAATLLMAVVVPLVGGSRPHGGPLLRVILAVLVLGAVGTGLAYLLFYRLVADIGPTRASMVTYFIPVVAVALGVVARGEPVTWNLFAGALVVFAGVALAEGRLGAPADRWARRRSRLRTP